MNAFLDPRNIEVLNATGMDINSARSSGIGVSESENLVKNYKKF